MTAGIVFGDVKLDWTSSTWTDSAPPGSQDLASFFSTPLSLPDSGPARATTASQKTMKTYLIQRPDITLATDLVMMGPPKVRIVVNMLAQPTGLAHHESEHLPLRFKEEVNP